MSAFDDLREDRALRNAAKSSFDANLGQVKADFAARGIGGRIADRATGEAKSAANHAFEVASDNKGVVAATAGALALWFAHKPLGRGIAALIDRFKH